MSSPAPIAQYHGSFSDSAYYIPLVGVPKGATIITAAKGSS